MHGRTDIRVDERSILSTDGLVVAKSTNRGELINRWMDGWMDGRMG